MSYKFKNQVTADQVHSELSDHILADGMELSVDLNKSYGAYIHDEISDSKYLDLFTCYASMPIGYNHPKMNNDEFINFIGRVALNKPSNSDLYSKEYASFVKTFWKVAGNNGFKYSFFIDGGALAVENALKTAFDWKTRKNMIKNVKTKDLKIIYFNEAFHGRSGYTMTITNTISEKVMYFPKFDWIKVDNPKIDFDNNNDIYKKEKRSLEQIKTAFSENKNQIAAIIIEPIQGEGGDNHFRNEFLQELKKVSLENDALLIFDEVQTGVGMTGTFWAYQQLEVFPDVLAFGKKMQVCGVLAGDRLDEVDDHVFKKSSRINSTWGGNLVDMVRVGKYLEIIEEEDLLINAKEMGIYLVSRLQSLVQEFGNMISNVRGRGLFIAFDINPNLRSEFLDMCFDHKLIILSCGERSIRFRPPLNISKNEIDKSMEIILKVLSDLNKGLD